MNHGKQETNRKDGKSIKLKFCWINNNRPAILDEKGEYEIFCFV